MEAPPSTGILQVTLVSASGWCTKEERAWIIRKAARGTPYFCPHSPGLNSVTLLRPARKARKCNLAICPSGKDMDLMNRQRMS